MVWTRSTKWGSREIERGPTVQWFICGVERLIGTIEYSPESLEGLTCVSVYIQLFEICNSSPSNSESYDSENSGVSLNGCSERKYNPQKKEDSEWILESEGRITGYFRFQLFFPALLVLDWCILGQYTHLSLACPFGCKFQNCNHLVSDLLHPTYLFFFFNWLFIPLHFVLLIYWHISRGSSIPTLSYKYLLKSLSRHRSLVCFSFCNNSIFWTSRKFSIFLFF